MKRKFSNILASAIFAVLFTCSFSVRAQKGVENLAKPSAAPAVEMENKVVQQCVEAVFNQIDPQKTRGLAEGKITPRVHRVMYYLHQAELDGVNPETVLDRAIEKIPKSDIKANDFFVPSATKKMLLENYQRAKAWNVFDDAKNLQKMKRGNAPSINSGESAGEKIEVDHCLPKSRFPELENNFANLRYLPESENWAKSAKITPDSLKLAEDLKDVWKPAESMTATITKEIAPAMPAMKAVGTIAGKGLCAVLAYDGATQTYRAVGEFKNGNYGRATADGGIGALKIVAGAGPLVGKTTPYAAEFVIVADGSKKMIEGFREGNVEKTSCGGIETTAGAIMIAGTATADPVLVIIGGGTYVGVVVYENREVIGNAVYTSSEKCANATAQIRQKLDDTAAIIYERGHQLHDWLF